MREKDLRGSDLRGMNLRRVKFFQANLQDADLRGSDLSDADFSYANLQGADLRGCIFGGSHATIFMGADMRGIILDEVLTDSTSGNCDLRGIKRGERTTEKYVMPQWSRDHGYDLTLSIKTAYETEAKGYVFTIIQYDRVEASRWYLYARPVGASLWVDNCSISALSADNLTLRDCKDLAEYLINDGFDSVKSHWVESGNEQGQPKPKIAVIEQPQETEGSQDKLIATPGVGSVTIATDALDTLKEILAFWETGEPIHPRVAEQALYVVQRLEHFLAD